MPQQNEFVTNALEATVRIGLLLVLAAWCFSIVQPFVIPLTWGIIIAGALLAHADASAEFARAVAARLGVSKARNSPES